MKVKQLESGLISNCSIMIRAAILILSITGFIQPSENVGRAGLPIDTELPGGYVWSESVARPDSTNLVSAERALERGDYGEAVDLYRSYLRAFPESYDARYGLGRALSYLSRHEEAADIFTQILLDYPEDPDVFVGRGYAYLHVGESQRAADDFIHALDLHPAYGDARVGLSRAFVEMGRKDLAVDNLTDWIAAEPGIAKPYLERARIYTLDRQYARARADLDAARQLGPDEVEYAEIEDILDARADRSNLTALAGYEFESFESDQAMWQQYHAGLSINANHFVLTGSYLHTTRFEKWGDAFALDGYTNLWRSAHLYARGLFGLGEYIHPDADLQAELVQEVGRGWLVLGGYRHFMYPGATIHAGRLGLEKYFANWYFRGEVNAFDAGDHVKNLYLFSARRFLGSTDSYVEGRVGVGNEIVDLGPDRTFHVGESYFASLRFQVYPTSWLGLSIAGNYTKTEPLPGRGGVSLTTMYRF